jgi:hypothetical protein
MPNAAREEARSSCNQSSHDHPESLRVKLLITAFPADKRKELRKEQVGDDASPQEGF